MVCVNHCAPLAREICHYSGGVNDERWLYTQCDLLLPVGTLFRSGSSASNHQGPYTSNVRFKVVNCYTAHFHFYFTLHQYRNDVYRHYDQLYRLQRTQQEGFTHTPLVLTMPRWEAYMELPSHRVVVFQIQGADLQYPR